MHLLCPLPQALWNQLLITLLSNSHFLSFFCQWGLESNSSSIFFSEQGPNKWILKSSRPQARSNQLEWKEGGEDICVSFLHMLELFSLAGTYHILSLWQSAELITGLHSGPVMRLDNLAVSRLSQRPVAAQLESDYPTLWEKKIMSSAWITVHSQCLVQRINIGHRSKDNNNASKILLTLGEFTFVTLFFFFFLGNWHILISIFCTVCFQTSKGLTFLAVNCNIFLFLGWTNKER